VLRATLPAMTEPTIPARGPYVLDMQPGVYAWCACGKSRKQPFCDGSHAGGPFVPVIEQITAPRRVAWCGCKRTRTKPFCDGAHACLPPA
jgi:CDGSH-type Zn-finger protein